MTINNLLLSKYLYQKGAETLGTNGPFSAGLAISLFQDATEMLIWAIAKDVDAQVKTQESFQNMWEIIKNAPKNSDNKSLPSKRKIIELNRARVGFKHFGNLPAPSEAMKFRSYTEDFLREAINIFFGTNFDDISLADIITHNEIKKYIKDAEKYYKSNILDQCLRCCAISEHIASNKLSSMFPKADTSLSETGVLFEREKISDGRRVFQYISNYLNALRDVCIVNMTDVRLPDYIRFKNCIPAVSQMGDGSFRAVFTRTKHSAEDARFCIDYVTRYAINLQEKMRKNIGT